jgi:hypothetical protein
VRKETVIAVMDALDFALDLDYGYSDAHLFHDCIQFIHRSSDARIVVDLWHKEHSFSYRLHKGSSSEEILRGKIDLGWGSNILKTLSKTKSKYSFF